MMKQLTSFKTAQYILLFFIVIICIWLAAWLVISASREKSQTPDTVNVIHITNNDPCAKRVNNYVSRLWAYTPENIPEKYLIMANEYANEKITTKTKGACNNIKFTCRAGQIRKDCDPCAINFGRQFAMEQQISDTISQECNK